MHITSTTERQAAIEAAIDVENGLRLQRHRRIKTSTGRLKLYKSFPRQRVGALTKILRHRHGSACLTDDGEVYLDLVAPFLVSAAGIEGGNAVAYVMKWSKLYVPAFADQIRLAGIEARVNALVLLDEEAKRTHTRWTPDMPTIVSSLRLTLEESRAIGLKGFGSINPPTTEDVKIRKRDHASKVRLAKGIVPQSQRTRTRDDKALAVCIDRSLRTIKRWRSAGSLDAQIQLMIQSGSLDGTKVCLQSLQGEYGGHGFVPPETAKNDNAAFAQTA